MEPILSKLQEGVKYPRFERDATKTINDLVDHITKERGVYSSSIEPNPNEHKMWFNTDNNTLYIYNGNEWKTFNNEDVHIVKEEAAFIPYPAINILNSTSYIDNWYIEENKHYVIIISANNIKEYLNNIFDNNTDFYRQYIIIGDETNTDGTFLVNIYDTYIYYIKLSSTNIEEDNVFYCNDGILFYDADDNNYGDDGIVISGYYTKERLRYVIENNEGKILENMYLNAVFIEPKDNATIIIGKQDFVGEFGILGEDLDDAKIYMYYDTLKIGGNCDDIANIDSINWYNDWIYCNCKNIGDITITHEESTLYLGLYETHFIVSNNNRLILDSSICSNIDAWCIYVIGETEDDFSDVNIEGEVGGNIYEYVNLCNTRLNTHTTNLQINIFITTSIDDIDVEDVTNGVFDIDNCELLIVDTPYSEFNHTNSLNQLYRVNNFYTTNRKLSEYLYLNYRVQVKDAINETMYYNDRVEIIYKDADTSKIIYNNTIYKR